MYRNSLITKYSNINSALTPYNSIKFSKSIICTNTKRCIFNNDKIYLFFKSFIEIILLFIL